MKRDDFQRELGRAQALRSIGHPPGANYWMGYMRGLRRRYRGEHFGDPGEHELWLSLADETDLARESRGKGYRAGYWGPVIITADPPRSNGRPVFFIDGQLTAPKTALRQLRAWRGWNRQALADRCGRTARTVEQWEQGLRNPGPRALRQLMETYRDIR